MSGVAGVGGRVPSKPSELGSAAVDSLKLAPDVREIRRSLSCPPATRRRAPRPRRIHGAIWRRGKDKFGRWRELKISSCMPTASPSRKETISSSLAAGLAHNLLDRERSSGGSVFFLRVMTLEDLSRVIVFQMRHRRSRRSRRTGSRRWRNSIRRGNQSWRRAPFRASAALGRTSRWFRRRCSFRRGCRLRRWRRPRRAW